MEQFTEQSYPSTPNARRNTQHTISHKAPRPRQKLDKVSYMGYNYRMEKRPEFVLFCVQQLTELTDSIVGLFMEMESSYE